MAGGKRRYQPQRRPVPGLHANQRLHDTEQRWRRRRFVALLLRATMVLAPLAASVVAMAVLSRTIPAPAKGANLVARLAWWGAVLAGSLLAMWCVDRLSRRLAPLAALCDMAVLFPGRAPTRLKVARRAGHVRQLEALKKQAGSLGRDDVATAAEQILALVGALRAHDRHTRGHSERVRVYTDLIADEMRLPAASVDRLRWAALLHDIGKLAVPAPVLNKPAKLSGREWEVVREHPAEGARLAGALLRWLGEWGLAIAEHHERFDGSGYPEGLQGKEISLAGRIVAVADAFEVMTAPRAYKRAMTRPAALEEMVRFSGSQFDPDVVRAFLHVSTPRLRWAMGPTSWLVGTPFLGAAPSLTGAGVAAQAAVGVTTAAVAGVTGLAAPVAAAPGPTPEQSAQPANVVATPASATVPVPAQRNPKAKPTAGTSSATPSATPSPSALPSAGAGQHGPNNTPTPKGTQRGNARPSATVTAPGKGGGNSSGKGNGSGTGGGAASPSPAANQQSNSVTASASAGNGSGGPGSGGNGKGQG